jgi:hypothetical protein
MTSLPEDRDHRDPGASKSMGKRIGAFGDYRATILTVIGCTLGVVGTILLADVILRRDLSNGIGSVLYWFVVGGVCFALAKFRYKNRLVLYHDGFVQIKWGRVDALRWRDIQQISWERVAHYSSGLAHKVRYQCALQRGDGTWLALDAILITPEVMKALQQSAGLPNSAGGNRGTQAQ